MVDVFQSDEWQENLPEEFDFIRTWQTEDITPDNFEGKLLPEGETEMYELAKRHIQRYPGLLSTYYSQDSLQGNLVNNHLIQHLHGARVAQSAVAYGLGLSSGRAVPDANCEPSCPAPADFTDGLRPFYMTSNTPGGDTLMNFPNICPNYLAAKGLGADGFDSGWEGCINRKQDGFAGAYDPWLEEATLYLDNNAADIAARITEALGLTGTNYLSSHISSPRFVF